MTKKPPRRSPTPRKRSAPAGPTGPTSPTTPPASVWTFDQPITEASASARLAIRVPAPALLHWSEDEWRTVQQEAAQPQGEAAYGWEFAPGRLASGTVLRFTFYWPEAGRWEGRDYAITCTD